MRRLSRGSAVVISAIAAFVLLGLVLFSAPGHDDSHIAYWAAHTPHRRPPARGADGARRLRGRGRRGRAPLRRAAALLRRLLPEPGLRQGRRDRRRRRPVLPLGQPWFELANKPHLRDTIITDVVLDAMREIKAKKPEHRFVVMSSQAGMTAYHVFKEHYGSAEFIDTCSLAARDFLTCLPPGVLSRRRIGVVLNFRTYFDEQAMIDQRCGTRRPDIVFDHSGRGVEAILERKGYSIVYRQRGPIKNEGLGPWLRNTVPSDTLVAIDTALLAGTSIEGKRTSYKWNIQ